MEVYVSTHNVKSEVLSGISKVVSDSGTSINDFYGQFNLSPSIENEIDRLVPFETFAQILQKLQHLPTTTHPIFQLAKIQSQRATSPFIDLVLNSPNIEVALQIGRRFRYTFSEITYWDWSVENDYAVIQRRSFAPLTISDRAHSLYAIAVVYLMLKKIVGENFRLKRLFLVQAEDNYKAEFDKFFQCPVSFSQDFDGYILGVNTLYEPNKNFDQVRYQSLLKALANHKVIFPGNQAFSTSVKGLILQMLSTGTCTLEAVANVMEMHPRALQKRLAKEALTFKAVLHEVRMNIAKRLLVQKEVPLTQISLMLGYSEASAFSRAFHKSEKCSPKKWRQNSCYIPPG